MAWAKPLEVFEYLFCNINLVDEKNLFVTSIRFIVSGVDE